MKVSVALLATALFVTAGMTGCSSKKADSSADVHATATTVAPTLYLNVTVGNHTFPFTTAKAAASSSSSSGHSGSASSASTSASTGNGTHSSTSSSAGNATHANGNATGNLTAPSGAAPLNVSITLGAKGLPSGKAIAWTFDFGDALAAAGNATKAAGNSTASASASTSGNHTSGNHTTGAAVSAKSPSGTKVPATLNHTFTAPGLHNMTFSLRVANGTATVLTASVTVLNGTGNATGLVAGRVLGVVPLDFSGTFTAGVGVGPPTPVNCGTGASGAEQTVDWVLPDKDANGTPAVVSSVLLTSSMPNAHSVQGIGEDADLYFIGPDGTTLASATTGSPNEAITVAGPFVAGTYHVSYRDCTAVNEAYTVHAEATLVAV